jgi:hypothetical protein
MLGNVVFAAILSGTAMMLAAGCGQTDFDAALGATLEQVDRIRNDDSLEPQEKRDQLAELLGVADASNSDLRGAVIINGLLQEERLANQFGGDPGRDLLSSAFDKVSDDRLDEMSPDEVQAYGDATEVTTYGDAEAQAIADFFSESAITSRAELEDFLDDATTELPPAIDATNLREVFVTTSLQDVRDKLP